MALRGTPTTSANATNITTPFAVNAVSGVQVGDLLLWAITTQASPATVPLFTSAVNGITSWTVVPGCNFSQGRAFNCPAVYYRIATSADVTETSYSVQSTGATPQTWALQMRAYSGRSGGFTGTQTFQQLAFVGAPPQSLTYNFNTANASVGDDIAYFCCAILGGTVVSPACTTDTNYANGAMAFVAGSNTNTVFGSDRTGIATAESPIGSIANTLSDSGGTVTQIAYTLFAIAMQQLQLLGQILT